MSNSILIVGTGPGIGQAAAERFGRAGWRVFLTGRNATRLGILRDELAAQGIEAHALPADATDPAALRAAMAEADRLAEGLSAVHYNAAVVRQQDLFSMTDSEVVEDLAINVAGGLHVIRAAVATFGTRGGTILVTGGGLGIEPHAAYASLGLGKAALRNVVQGLAGPLAERGIRIALATVATLVNPGSAEARDVAETLWHLATDAEPAWEVSYPAQPAVSTASPLTLIAKLTAKPEQAAALGEDLRGLIAPTLAEEGALSYRLHRDQDDQAVWILYETWRSRADLDAHFRQPYTRAVMARFPERLAKEMELTFCSEVTSPDA